LNERGLCPCIRYCKETCNQAEYKNVATLHGSEGLKVKTGDMMFSLQKFPRDLATRRIFDCDRARFAASQYVITSFFPAAEAMLKINRVLYATDLSDVSRQAAVVASEIVHRTGAELHVVTVDIEGSAGQPSSVEAVRAWMAAAIDNHGHQGPVTRGVVEIIHGISASQGILGYVRDFDIDLVVVGSHGRRGIQRALIGSVAEDLLRRSEVPVLVVRQEIDGPRTSRMHDILVPIDFSEHSENALQEAAGLAGYLDTPRIHLLHVISESLHPAFYNTGVISIYDVEPDIEDRSCEELRKLYDAAGNESIPVTIRTTGGNPAEEIARYAEINDIHLIVMGTHGRSGIERFLVGSVTEKVNRLAPCPVLTLRSFGRGLLPGV
jgi:nucleotide-binding universal stress UspA family protein